MTMETTEIASGAPAGTPRSRRNARAEASLSTAHLQSSLKHRTVSSGLVTGLSQGALFVLTLGSIAALARLLPPADFGLLAMVTTITGFLRIFNDAGLSTATVQRQGITHAQVSNLFWANVAIAGTITVLLALCAPLIAWFFREPRLVGITLALCVTFLLTGSSVQHLAVLKRQMRFKAIAVIQISSAAAGMGIGIGMAWFGWGYWSLVVMQLTTPVLACILTWWMSHWRPQWPARGSGTRSLLGFGANLTVSSFLWSLARGADGVIIGRMFGSASLGLYSRAQALLVRPIEQFIAPVEAVFLPTLSRLQDQPERYRRVTLQIYEIMAVSSFLFSGMLLALSLPLTLVVLGPQWREAAPIFAGFSLVALYSPVACVSSWLLSSQGRGQEFLLQSTVAAAVTVLAFLAGSPFGPAGIAMAYSAACILVHLPVAYHIAGRRGPVRAKDLWSRFFTHLPVWIVVSGATFLAHSFFSAAAPLTQLLLCGPAGLLAGATFILIYPPSRKVAAGLMDCWQLLRETPKIAPAQA